MHKQAKIVFGMIALAIAFVVVIGIVRPPHKNHSSEPPVVSAQVPAGSLKELHVLSAAQNPTAYPQEVSLSSPQDASANAFVESTDGDQALTLEDVNGDGSIWKDEKTGSRIFCLSASSTGTACLTLPTMAGETNKVGKNRKGTRG